jgi:transposase
VPEEVSVPEPLKAAVSPATRRRVWRPEQIDQAAALHKAGRSVQKIADELGLTRSTTRRLLVRAGRVQEASEDAIENRRLRLRRVAGHLERGLSFPAASERAGVTVEAARALIRQGRELLPEPLPKSLLRQATALKARLGGGDVRAAAHEEGLDPWWALLLLVLAGFEQVSMQPQRQPEMLARIEQMAAWRAAGATFGQIGEEFGISRERAPRLLLATGQWTPLRSARRASP